MLNTVLGSNICDVAMQTKALNATRIEFFYKIREMDPLVAPAYRLLNFNPRAAKNFNVMLKHMRNLSLIGDQDSEAKALRNGGYQSVNDYVEKRLARVKAPENLNLMPPLRQIFCGEELSFIANQWRNCLRAPAYRIALGLGSKIFVMMDGTVPGDEVLASLERTAFGWQMDECEMPMKRQATDEMRQRMVDLLIENGIAADTTTFAMAFSELDRCPEPICDDDWTFEFDDADKSEH